jgi:DNA primase
VNLKNFIQRHSNPQDDDFRDYISSRGLSVADVEPFKLGFYKKNHKDCMDFGIPKSIDSAVLLPMFDDLLQPVGFELRSTKQKRHHKWIAPDSRFQFFGLNQRSLESIWSFEEVFLVEGTFDAISFSLFKPNVLSLMGNKLSAGHIRFIQRYAKTVWFCLDKDKWGMIMQDKMSAELRSKGMNVGSMEAIVFSDGVKDANDLLKKLGRDRFLRTLSQRYDSGFRGV